jgi:GNAT superfamily N-acetyltransferase
LAQSGTTLAHGLTQTKQNTPVGEIPPLQLVTRLQSNPFRTGINTIMSEPMPLDREMTHISSPAQADMLAGRQAAAARTLRLRDGRAVTLRVAESGDVSAVQQFVRGLSDRSRYNRFFSTLRELSADQLYRVTRSRPPTELALVGEAAESGESCIVAMAQYAVCETSEAEFAVVVDDAWQGQGLGMQLIGVLAECAARAGFAAFTGYVLANNRPMRALLDRLDCQRVTGNDPCALRFIKRLDAHSANRYVEVNAAVGYD